MGGHTGFDVYQPPTMHVQLPQALLLHHAALRRLDHRRVVAVQVACICEKQILKPFFQFISSRVGNQAAFSYGSGGVNVHRPPHRVVPALTGLTLGEQLAEPGLGLRGFLFLRKREKAPTPSDSPRRSPSSSSSSAPHSRCSGTHSGGIASHGAIHPKKASLSPPPPPPKRRRGGTLLLHRYVAVQAENVKLQNVKPLFHFIAAQGLKPGAFKR